MYVLTFDGPWVGRWTNNDNSSSPHGETWTTSNRSISEEKTLCNFFSILSSLLVSLKFDYIFFFSFLSTARPMWTRWKISNRYGRKLSYRSSKVEEKKKDEYNKKRKKILRMERSYTCYYTVGSKITWNIERYR